MSKSMWNLKNIDNEIKNSPSAILREQAEHFEKETKQVLYARIDNVTLKGNPDFEYKLASNFSIMSPALDNYTYTIFTVYSNPESNYPLAITINFNKKDDLDWFQPDHVCKDEEEFIKALDSIIASEKVTEIVHILYSKSKNY